MYNVIMSLLRSKFATREEYNQYFRDYREKNRKKLRKYNREYNKAWRKKYGYASEKRYRKNNPEKTAAGRLLRYAVKAGKIIRKNCEKCGSIKSQAHHDDYTKPLEVRWLCSIHHAEFHRNQNK